MMWGRVFWDLPGDQGPLPGPCRLPAPSFCCYRCPLNFHSLHLFARTTDLSQDIGTYLKFIFLAGRRKGLAKRWHVYYRLSPSRVFPRILVYSSIFSILSPNTVYLVYYLLMYLLYWGIIYIYLHFKGENWGPFFRDFSPPCSRA